MKTEVNEIASGVYRLSTFLPSVGPTGFTFNQFLIDAEEPLLFHYGQRALFPLISDAVKRVIPLDRLRWLTCSHGEADESGALNEWLAAAPKATPAHGMIGCNIWLRDSSNRDPRVLKNDEVIDLGGKRVRWLDTPHMPHGWDAGLIYEERTGTLFTSDLFTQVGAHPVSTDRDIVAPSIATEQRLPFLPITATLAPQLRKLAELKPKTLALMHGAAFTGDGGAALAALGDHYGAAFSPSDAR
jgi:flavorubredoxin